MSAPSLSFPSENRLPIHTCSKISLLMHSCSQCPPCYNVWKDVVGDMIDAAVDDFGVLDYSITSAGAVLDTLAILSTAGGALGTASQASMIRMKV